MINISNKLIVNENFDLNAECRTAMSYVSDLMVRRYGDRHSPDPVLAKRSLYAWQLYVDRLPNRLILDAQFVQQVYRIVAEGEKKGIGILMQVLQDTHGSAYEKFSDRAHRELRRCFKLVLMHLWFKGVVLLPLTFTLGSMNTYDDFVNDVGTEVYRFFRGYESGVAHRPAGAEPLSQAAEEVFIKHAPRVVMASNWHAVEDVSIDEMAVIHRAYQLSQTGDHDCKLPPSPFPFQAMLSELLLCHPNRVGYKSEDMDLYDAWLGYGKGSPNITKPTFADYRKEPELYEAKRKLIKQQVVDQVNQVRNDRAKQRTAEKRAAFLQLSGMSADEPLPIGVSEKAVDFKRGAAAQLHEKAGKIHARLRLVPDREAAHEAIIEYFQEVKGSDLRMGDNWLRNACPYPGREKALADFPNMTAIWDKAFTAWTNSSAFKKSRIDQGNARMAMNFLMDFIFLYLVWFKELFPESPITVPFAPRDFQRVWFVDQSMMEILSPVLGPMPRTLLEMLELRREASSSQYAILVQLDNFFGFIQTNFRRIERIAGPHFSNPLSRKDDFPVLKRPNRSTKIAIDPEVYRFVVDYGYAVEGFGEYLLQKANEANLFEDKARRNVVAFTTDDWGYTPVVFTPKGAMPVRVVPNVFTFAERVFRTSSGARKIHIPHLTILRQHLLNIESGLRIQAIRWLDLRTWDKYNTHRKATTAYSKFVYEGNYYLELYVNTDKAHDSFKTSIPFRCRASMYREVQFRQSIEESGMMDEVWYNYIEDHPFGQILPLFRSTHSPGPFSDGTMDEYWIAFWAGFEAFYNGAYDSAHKLCPESEGYRQFVCTSQEKATGAVPGGVLGPGSVPPHDIKAIIDSRCAGYLAIHTEHASRTTYVTIRGIGEDILSNQLAITPAKVRYYYAPGEAQTAKKAEYADKVLHGLIPHEFDAADPVNIHAEAENSRVMESMRQDRAATIDAFGFVPPVALWSSSDMDKADWRQLLLNGPMSHLKPYPTHICAAGGECPQEILETFGERERCGACPYSMRCVDHLRAITGKIRQLRQRIKFAEERIQAEMARGADPASKRLEQISNGARVDAVELQAWQLTEEYLLDVADRLARGEKISKYHVINPEFIERKLRSFTRPSTEVTNLLLLTADARAYPWLAFDDLERRAERTLREINRKLGKVESAAEDVPLGMEIESLLTAVTPWIELAEGDVNKAVAWLTGEHGEKLPSPSAQLGAPAEGTPKEGTK